MAALADAQQQQTGTPSLADSELIPTATVLAEEAVRLEATRQAIETRRSQTVDIATLGPTNIDRFEVRANTWRNSTGIVVQSGDRIHIEYLEGQWTGDSSNAGLTQGCGFRYDDSVLEHVWVFPPEERGAALVGYINSAPFFIGCRPLDYLAPSGGELFLGMSDCDGCFWDNSGQLYVKVEVTRP